MQVLIRVAAEDGDTGADLTSLFRWFQRDGQLAAIELSLVPQRKPGAQGGLFDVINALIGDGVGIGGLALSFAAWRQAHRSTATMTIERDGVKIQVTDASAETVSRLVSALSVENPPPDTESTPEPAEPADPDAA
jgi:hypothetical protein